MFINVQQEQSPISAAMGLMGQSARMFRRGDCSRIEQALVVADRAHNGAKHGREPYILHPIRVASNVMSVFGVDVISNADAVVAAVLHDVVEDAPDVVEHMYVPVFNPDVDGGNPAVAVISAMFGEDVARIVRALSHPDGDNASYVVDVASAINDSFSNFVVKFGDFKDNAGRIDELKPARARRLLEKYAPVLREFRGSADMWFVDGVPDNVSEEFDSIERVFDRVENFKG